MILTGMSETCFLMNEVWLNPASFDPIHFREDIEAENTGKSRSCLNKTSEHGDSRGFASSIVAKECEYLTFVYV